MIILTPPLNVTFQGSYIGYKKSCFTEITRIRCLCIFGMYKMGFYKSGLADVLYVVCGFSLFLVAFFFVHDMLFASPFTVDKGGSYLLRRLKGKGSVYSKVTRSAYGHVGFMERKIIRYKLGESYF